MDLEVDRKAPPYDPSNPNYKQPQATRGVEIELLDDYTPIAAKFIDPNVQNSVGTANAPIRVRSDTLRYRVRFRYPIDNVRVDKKSDNTVKPATQYLLDTPVFDDISVTYTIPLRMIWFKETTE